MPQQIIFVRHGETTYNSKDHKANRFMGWNDHVKLSDQGKLDALATAHKLKEYPIDYVYHSDLIRTTETAKIISSQLRLTPKPTKGIRERNLGNFAEHTAHEIKESRPADLAKFFDHADPDWNGLEGESLRDVHTRFHSFLMQLHSHHSGQSVLLISHSGIIHTILRDYFKFFPIESFIEVDHSSVTILTKHSGKYELTLHNA